MIDGSDVSQIQRLEANRKVDGIIVSRAVVSSKVQKYLKNCKEPYILIGPSSNPEVPFVDNKNREARKRADKYYADERLSESGTSVWKSVLQRYRKQISGFSGST